MQDNKFNQEKHISSLKKNTSFTVSLVKKKY